MGRIFLSAGHGGLENGIRDPGVVAGGTTEAQEMIRIREWLAVELRSRGHTAYSIPDTYNQVQTIDWINYYGRQGDVAIELQTGGSPNPSVRGVTMFHIANNTQRRADAQLVLKLLLRQVPQFPNRGVKPDTDSGLGRLIFCRWVIIPSLYVEIGYLTNPQDRALIQTRYQDIARGLADGLIAWVGSESINPTPPLPPGTPVYDSIGVQINGQYYGNLGILVNGNAHIPVDLVDKVGIDAVELQQIQRIRYRNVVYARAIDLRNFGVSVTWDNPNRTVILRSVSRLFSSQIDQIMGRGNVAEAQLVLFLKSEHPAGLIQFPEITQHYVREAGIEGVNHDIAFCQMCLETEFLRFNPETKASQNNFASLGAARVEAGTATFPNPKTGVRAHIQHLKAYASTEPLVQAVVDPRFSDIQRGVAPSVLQLGGRWSADLRYGDRILALVQRLYEAADLL
ncbi:MAG: hormogonium tapered terminus morphoprotein TftA [Microcoleaceae cyanobacterium]